MNSIIKMISILSYDELINRIKEKGFNEKEIERKINRKLEELSGLISREGAAHLIANELGIKIFEDIGEIKINKIINGMRSIDVCGKVIINYGVREYKTEKRAGRVGSFLIGDETARIRVSVWDEIVINNLGELKEGDVIKIKNAYSRENNGWIELHLGNRGGVEINPKGVVIEKVAEPISLKVFKEIKDLNENDRNIGLKGTIVQLFEPRFYEVCEICGKRIHLENGNFKCLEHNIVNPKYAVVLNFFLDDGSDNIRVVAFRDQAKNVLNVDENRILGLKENLNGFESIKEEVLGRQVEVIGRVVKNEMFNRKEFIASNIQELNPEKLIENLG